MARNFIPKGAEGGTPRRDQFVDALRDVWSLAAAPNPDSRLLVACDRFFLLHEECDRLYRQHLPGHMKRVREILPESDALKAEITAIPARTAAGRCAKAEAALCMLPREGTHYRLVRSALQDFINNAAGVAGAV